MKTYTGRKSIDVSQRTKTKERPLADLTPYELGALFLEHPTSEDEITNMQEAIDEALAARDTKNQRGGS